MQKKALSKVLP